jgi:putative spermidine/putrescine transport system permease protein
MSAIRPRFPLHRLTVGLLTSFLILPVISTILYSLSREWGATILPRSVTFAWYGDLWTDPRFLAAFGRSLLLGFTSLGLSAVVVIPAVFVVRYRFPRLEGLLGILSVLPLAVPPIVSSVGLLQIYSQGPLPLTGTPWILVGTSFTIALPFVHRAVSNAMDTLELRDLMDAAHLLGASTPGAFFRLVLPNIRGGVMIALLVSLSFLLGEFVFANLLVGTRFETLQVYLFNRRGVSGHLTSAIVTTYLLFTLLLTAAAAGIERLCASDREPGKELEQEWGKEPRREREPACLTSKYGDYRKTSAPQGS